MTTTGAGRLEGRRGGRPGEDPGDPGGQPGRLGPPAGGLRAESELPQPALGAAPSWTSRRARPSISAPRTADVIRQRASAGPSTSAPRTGVVRVPRRTPGPRSGHRTRHVEIDGGGASRRRDLERGHHPPRDRRHGAGPDLQRGGSSFDGTFSDGPQSLETSNERIDLRLPAGASFAPRRVRPRATRTSPLEGFDIRTTGAAGRDTLQGTVGSGGPSITLRTSSNPIAMSAHVSAARRSRAS